MMMVMHNDDHDGDDKDDNYDAYLIIVIFFTLTQDLENKIYT